MRRAVVLAAACAALAGCRAQPPQAPPDSGPPRLVRLDELTEAEKQYGRSARPTSQITYQPDVVMPAAGASAIRGVSADGLVWTIDPTSEGVEAIAPGKVLLLTNRAAGRVLAVQKASDGLRVVLGPAEITDVIREGHFTVQQPVDVGQALQFKMPEVFESEETVQPILARSRPPDAYGMFRTVAFRRVAAPAVQRFKLTPLVGPNGVGVEITSNAGGVQFLGQAVLYLKAPSLYFVLDIRPPGKIVTCDLQLDGVAGLLLAFEAASPNPYSANINHRRFAAIDYSIPLSGMGIPFAVNVRQQFELKTAFTSTGTLKARGYYKLRGGLRAGYRDGKFSLGGPSGFNAQETILPSLNGVAIGVTGLVMTHQVNVIVGIGQAGFVAGPYVFLNSSVGVTRGSSIANFSVPMPIPSAATVCKQESVSMGVGAGVGYRIPQPVTDAINAVLRALQIREEIKGFGGIETKPVVLVKAGWYTPKLEICGG